MTDQKIPVVIVEKIKDNSKNPGSPYKWVQLRTETSKAGGNNILSQFLKGPAFLDKRVCAQTMHTEMIDKFEVAEGVDLNECFLNYVNEDGVSEPAQPVRLTITEITQAEYDAMVKAGDENYLGFQAKINPADQVFLLDANGNYIYRNVSVTGLDAQDKFVQHTSTTAVGPDGTTLGEEVEESVEEEDELTA